MLPLFFYREQPCPQQNFMIRKGLLFVGGFNHTPNVDAVLWFVTEIFPVISARLPDVFFYVVGSNPPPQLLALHGERVRVLGFVDDQRLNSLYDEVRMVVVPLRFGAGVKGKVVEAIHKGVPLVSTSIGLEGIPGVGACLAGVDTAGDFATRVATLYADASALEQLSAAQCAYAVDHLSEAAAKAKLCDLLEL
jgi:glycosyltransferase involved in cell wall biosynthesis